MAAVTGMGLWKRGRYNWLNLLMDIIMVLAASMFFSLLRDLITLNEAHKSKPLEMEITSVTESPENTLPVIRIGEFISTTRYKQMPNSILPSSSVPQMLRALVHKQNYHGQFEDMDRVSAMNVIRDLRENSIIRVYTADGVASAYVEPEGILHNEDYPFDITLVTCADVSDLENIKLKEQWGNWFGPISLGVFADEQTDSEPIVLNFLKRVRDSEFADRFSLSAVYTHLYSSLFPGNFLKNVATASVITTHSLAVDLNMVPSMGLYTKLRLTPRHLLYSPTHVITIPVFSGVKPVDTRESLIECIDSNKCYAPTSDYPDSLWYNEHILEYMIPVSCIDSRVPMYILQRRSSFSLWMDEHFLTPPFDNTHFIELIRSQPARYSFYTLTHEFFFRTLSFGPHDVEREIWLSQPEFSGQLDMYLSLLPTGNTTLQIGNCISNVFIATGEKKKTPQRIHDFFMFVLNRDQMEIDQWKLAQEKVEEMKSTGSFNRNFWNQLMLECQKERYQHYRSLPLEM